MKVKMINQSAITADDITEYKKRVSTLKGNFFTGNDVGMDKRIVTVRMETLDTDLVLVNPKIQQPENPKATVYYELDSKNKPRKTVRLTEMMVETDNLGLVEFKSIKEKWEDMNDLMTDMGMFECVGVQRAIDAINGIDITHPIRAYSETVVRSEPKVGRNERVMMQGPDGDMVFIKHKHSKQYLDKGYKFM